MDPGLVLLILGVSAFAHGALADIYLMTSTYTFDPIPDVPADFGPDIGDGVVGYLRVADPLDSCSAYTFTDFETPWVALIARNQPYHPTNCTFDVKVMFAQQAGAIAAIVYDDTYEALIIMSKPPGNPDPSIPSVFVSQKAGVIMQKLLELDEIRVSISSVTEVAWMSMLMSALLGCLALAVVLATFYVMRSWSAWLGSQQARHAGPGGAAGAAAGAAAAAQARADGGGLSPRALRSLPVLIFDSCSRTCSRATSLAHMPVRSGMLGTSQSGNGAPAAAATTSMDSGFDAGLSSGMNGDEALFEITSLAAQGAESAGGLDNAAGQSVSVCMQKEEEEWECASQHSSHSSQYDEGLRIPGVHAGETKRLCAVCLEHYSDGEKVRQLPCQHRYHMSCIDQWLSTRRVCPVCKHDASKPLSLSPPPLAVAAGTGPTTAGTSSTGVGSTGGTAAVPNEAATSGRGAVSLLPGWMRSAWTFMYGGAPARSPGRRTGNELHEPLLQTAADQGQLQDPAAADVETGGGSMAALHTHQTDSASGSRAAAIAPPPSVGTAAGTGNSRGRVGRWLSGSSVTRGSGNSGSGGGSGAVTEALSVRVAAVAARLADVEARASSSRRYRRAQMLNGIYGDGQHESQMGEQQQEQAGASELSIPRVSSAARAVGHAISAAALEGGEGSDESSGGDDDVSEGGDAVSDMGRVARRGRADSRVSGNHGSTDVAGAGTSSSRTQAASWLRVGRIRAPAFSSTM